MTLGQLIGGVKNFFRGVAGRGRRSAEWHSAVSRIVNPQGWENFGGGGK